MDKYPIVPGRGLVNKSGFEARQKYLADLGFHIDEISKSELIFDQLGHNIESHIGSVEVPVGLAGPLLFKNEHSEELIHTPVGTLEGALLASMNRGAKVVSLCGGFSAAVVHQKMIRTPMFVFIGLSEAMHFKSWIADKFGSLQQIASQYSNHAKLIQLEPIISGRSVHVHFIYTTGDASGQNMTTTCTWKAMQWVLEKFDEETNIKPVHALIEGNGASDKKASIANMRIGRGVNVVAECNLLNEHIEKVLRTTADELLACWNASLGITRINGMMSTNINVANAIAGIFVATGQDLASIHESANGILMVERNEQGLYMNLQLPGLVISTIGGGTHLPAQQEALKLMGCSGTNNIERFAKIIAGFALSLEISTFAAIVGGQFASSHEKLGRNKPVNWITRSEIDTPFIGKILKKKFPDARLKNVSINYQDFSDNGILMHLAQKVNQKPKGFIVLDLEWDSDASEDLPAQLIIKSKATGMEVIKGLHLMASAIDPNLAQRISEHKNYLEYRQCHLKELAAYRWLDKAGFRAMPEFMGSYKDKEREVYIVLMEFLHSNELQLFNSEEAPESWTDELIFKALDTIHKVHKMDTKPLIEDPDFPIREFKAHKAISLYRKMAEILISEYKSSELEESAHQAAAYVEDLLETGKDIDFKKTWVHNDFNPRNIAVRKDGKICIYDWELAVLDYPQRDLVEFLSFTLPLDFEISRLDKHLQFHYALWAELYDFRQWKAACLYSLKVYLASRVLFYMNGRIILDFNFAERIFKNTLRMIQYLEKLSAW